MLTAEQLLDSIDHLTGVWEAFGGLPAGTRATQLPSPDQKNEFLKTFGQPDRETACACERATDSNLTQALQLFNGSVIHEKLQNETNRFRTRLASGADDVDVLQELYLAAYCRFPSDEEIDIATRHLESQDDRILAWEDICWTLINSKEFLFRH